MHTNWSSKTSKAQNILLKLCTVLQKYLEQAQDLVFNENVLLQTLGFDVAIDHPHTHVVRCCHLVRGKCLAVVTRRGGKCRQQVYFWGYWSWMELFLLQKFIVWNYVLECVLVYHIVIRMYCHLCCQEFAHIIPVCTVFKFALMCQWCGGYHNHLWTFLFSALTLCKITPVPLSCHRFSIVTVFTNVVSISLLPSFVAFLWFLMDRVHCVCLVLLYA